MIGEDGHDTSCTFRKCAHPESPEPCPFLRDQIVKLDDPRIIWVPPAPEGDCKHEWRQLVMSARTVRFFCIYCLERHK